MAMGVHALAFPVQTRQRLTSMLRRRVPEGEAEDLAQTVLCDAMAASNVPSDPVEFQRWLSTIARNKVADFHRRARRHACDALDDETPAAPGAPYDARDLLDRVLSVAEHKDPETTRWLVREHEGERLADIADEVGLPAPVVRQRVSRLRRALRARFAGALLGALALVGVSAALRSHTDPAGIAAEPGPVDAALGPLQGTWRVVSFEPDRSMPVTERRWLSAEAAAAEVRIRGSRVDVAVPTGTRSLEITSSEGSGPLQIVLTDPKRPNGHPQRTTAATVRLEGARAYLALQGGRGGGVAVLERR